MNISGDFEIIKDVFSENDFYCLKETLINKNGKIGAVLSLQSGHVDSNVFSMHYAIAFEKIIAKITSKKKKFGVWLLLSAVVSSQSKIARYKKLWKTFDHSAVGLPDGERSVEYAVESKSGMSFFGAIFLKNPDFFHIAKFIGMGRYGCLAITQNKNNEIEKILQRGWGSVEPHFYGYPKEIIQFSCSSDIFFIRPIGAFDDREWGAVALARTSLIKEIFNEAN